MESERRKLEQQMLGGLMAVLIVSVPLLKSDLGYLRNGTGFQGITSHPQAFGVTMALLGAWVAAGLLVERHPSMRQLAVLSGILGAVLLSESRTAGVAVVAGVVSAVLITLARRGSSVRGELPALLSRRVHAWTAVGIVALIVAAPLVGTKMWVFMQKRTDSGSVGDMYAVSRGGLINMMWSNIEEHPITGIGFGIASDPASMIVTADPVLGLPIGAAVEKGVTPIAIVEEVGIPGALAVLAWAFMLVRGATRGGVRSLTVMSTCLFVNMGEAVLFSPGGMGLLLLILFTWAATAPSEPSGMALQPVWQRHLPQAASLR